MLLNISKTLLPEWTVGRARMIKRIYLLFCKSNQQMHRFIREVMGSHYVPSWGYEIELLKSLGDTDVLINNTDKPCCVHELVAFISSLVLPFWLYSSISI